MLGCSVLQGIWLPCTSVKLLLGALGSNARVKHVSALALCRYVFKDASTGQQRGQLKTSQSRTNYITIPAPDPKADLDWSRIESEAAASLCCKS